MQVYRLPFQKSEVQVYTCGNPNNQPVILLHGFMQDGRSWENVAQELSSRFFLLLPDFPGHGATISPYEAEEFSLSAHANVVDMLVEALKQGAFGACLQEKPVVIGYSMGGRIAAQYAVDHPQKLKAVILESAGLGIADEADRAARKEKNEKLCARLAEESFDLFVKNWEELPLFASQKNLSNDLWAAQHQARLENDPQALRYSLRYAGQHEMTCLEEPLVNTGLNLLYLAGELDVTYTKIAQQFNNCAKYSSSIQVQIVKGVGHNIHLENPDLYCRIVMEYLKKM